MITPVILIIYGLFLILGGFMGFKKGSKISLFMGLGSGILVFVGLGLLSYNPKMAWIFLTCLNMLLTLVFASRLIKTRAFMPSGMLLVITMGVFIFCVIHLI